MALFVWNDDYSLRIGAIDEQHKRLVGLLNALHEGMVAGHGNEKIGPLLDGLIDYTARHFAYEEQLFAEHGYPEAAAHTAEHRRLVDQVLEFKSRYEAGSAQLTMQLMKFLKDWLIKHILGSDKAYGAHLAERGVR
jgi:hemerythrin